MVTARRRTVLTPKLPGKVKAEEVREIRPPLPGRRYRARPTDPSPFGGFDPPLYSDDLAVITAQHEANLAAGLGSIIEEHNGPAYSIPRHA